MGRNDGYKNILAERRGRVLTLTLNRPAQLNAVDAELHSELSRIFVDARHDADADIVVLTGADRSFCAGGDLAWMQKPSTSRQASSRPPARPRRSCSVSSISISR